MKRKDLSELKWAVLDDLFYSALDENAVLKKHNVTRTTYERWLRQKLFSRQFQQYTASLARRTALAVAKAETEVAVRLVELTRCNKEESARKACQNVLAIANRFFETVARINEGPLEGKSKRIYPQRSGDPYGGASWNSQTGNRGVFGGKRGENGGNRGKKEEEKRRPTLAARSTIYHSPITNHQALAGEYRDIFGLNQPVPSGVEGGASGAKKWNSDLAKMTYSQYSRILAILAEDVDEKEEEEQRRIKNNEGEKTKISV
jgi:hypothetical protein